MTVDILFFNLPFAVLLLTGKNELSEVRNDESHLRYNRLEVAYHPR